MSDNVINFNFKKFQKDTETDHIPTVREVLDRIQAVRDKYEELDQDISRIIDDVDAIKKSRGNDSYISEDFGVPWKQLTLNFRLKIAKDTDDILGIIEEELL